MEQIKGDRHLPTPLLCSYLDEMLFEVVHGTSARLTVFPGYLTSECERGQSKHYYFVSAGVTKYSGVSHVGHYPYIREVDVFGMIHVCIARCEQEVNLFSAAG